MEANLKEIQELIESSFLSENDKKTLFKLLENKGPTDEFFEKMNQLISDEILSISDRYQKEMKQLDQKFSEADNSLEEKKKELEEQLQKDLRAAKEDASKKDKLWEDYYAAVEQIYKDNEDKLRDIAVSTAKKAIDT